jgi:ferredoxin
MLRNILSLALCVLVSLSAFGPFIETPKAEASALKDYKKQKHRKKKKKVTSDSCQSDYTADCIAKCNGEEACVASCKANAAQFCKDRDSRRTRKKWELAGKAATLGAGAIGMIFDNKMQEVVLDPNGNIEISPYAINWNAPSTVVETSFGALEAGALGVGLFSSYRYKWIGASGRFQFLWDDGENLVESEFGPSFNFATQHIMVSLQPALLISGGNGVDSEYGFGVRTNNMFIISEKMLAQFDPMLGYINSQWAYHLRVGATYRWTPQFFMGLNYEYRDILDLNDLDISQAALQGAFLTLGFRMN